MLYKNDSVINFLNEKTYKMKNVKKEKVLTFEVRRFSAIFCCARQSQTTIERSC